jgi:Zn-dependent protease
MAIITIAEIIGLIVITLYIGYIFTGIVRLRPKTVYDIMNPRKLDLRDFKFAILVSAPAVVLHELAHKFVAMLFGYSATFQAFYSSTFTLILAGISIVLKAVGSPFILIVPGFVQIASVTDPIVYRLIAFAGPFLNLLLWLTATLMLKYIQNLKRNQMVFLAITKQINMWLFIFNMLPLFPLDGSKVLFGP